ncbi:MAG: glycosyl transferase [Ferruginibacter sp.]|nr:glycosyl transferase [Ferruginibacter sp.]
MQNKYVIQGDPVAVMDKPIKKKILFACVPADGHFNPLTGIAKHLQLLGYDVRWYSSSAYKDKLEKLQIPYYPFERAMEVTGDTVDQIFPDRKGMKNPIKKLNYDIINFFIQRGPEYFADMLNIYRTFPFDLVIADCAFTAIPFITDKMNIPVISIGVFPLTEKSKDLAPNGLAMTPDNSFAGKIKQTILHFAADKILFRKSNKEMKRVMDEYNIDCNKSTIFDLLVKKSTLLLQSGTPGFEYRRSDLGKNVRFIGPLLPYSSNTKKKEWFDKRLNEYKQVILVTQGTVERNPEKILIPTLEAFKGSTTLVVATTGGSQTKELRERFPYKNIIIEDFIPFEDVMPYADVYVTNGGYGGVMLAIENHLPLVVAGVHEGKNEINARVGYFKLGVNLKTETPTPQQLKKAVTEVLTYQFYRDNVVKLSKEFADFDPYALCAGYVKQLLENGHNADQPAVFLQAANN